MVTLREPPSLRSLPPSINTGPCATGKEWGFSAYRRPGGQEGSLCSRVSGSPESACPVLTPEPVWKKGLCGCDQAEDATIKSAGVSQVAVNPMTVSL